MLISISCIEILYYFTTLVLNCKTGKEGSGGRAKAEGGDDLSGELGDLEVRGSLGLAIFNIINKIIALFQGSHAEPQKSAPRVLI